MHITLTGSHGFIGTHLRESLESQGHILDCWDNKIGRNANHIKLLPETDLVIHLSALADVRRSLEEPEIYWEQNVECSQNIFNLCNEKGIKPKKREVGKKFFVKKFPTLSESVRSYLKNINTHLAYEDFRQERRKLRMNGESLSGNVLANFLKNYSERSQAYVDDLKLLIETNNFMKFDKTNGLLN